jgi:hypothetical protein
VSLVRINYVRLFVSPLTLHTKVPVLCVGHSRVNVLSRLSLFTHTLLLLLATYLQVFWDVNAVSTGKGFNTFRIMEFSKICIQLRPIYNFQAPSQNCEKRLRTSSCQSVCPPAWKNSAPTGRMFMKFYI